MKTSEIRELSIKEIEERIENEKNFLFRQRLNHAISPLDNPLKLRESRRNIARLNTILNQKISESKQANQE
ncbi:MAG: 50S ribosomal protein L29 [Bacteroidales bacterium]|nr:50S ribosomal protein L29 [Bacteroidales bacterium]MBN2763154.1 50S ribosomal protein L29 [Bacteroidales bacterium]